MSVRALRPLVVLLVLALVGLGCSSSDDSTGPEPVVPTVLSVNPADGAIHVSSFTSINVLFSVAMDEASVEAALSLDDPNPAPISFSTDWQGNLLEITPDGPLAAETVYTLGIGVGAESEAGEPLAAAFTSSFTTLPNHPVVLSTQPIDGATGVGTNVSPQIQFSMNMDQSSTEAALSVSPTASFSVTWLDLDLLRIVFDSDLDPSTPYNITVDATAAAVGGSSTLGTDYVFGFTTGTGTDNTPPSIVSYSPANGATNVSTDVGQLIITFSEPIQDDVNPESIDVRFYLAVLGSPELSPDGMTFTVTLAPLAPGCTYEVDLGPIHDLVGNAYDPPSYRFTTAGTAELFPYGVDDEWYYAYQDDTDSWQTSVQVMNKSGDDFDLGIYEDAGPIGRQGVLWEVDHYTRSGNLLTWNGFDELDGETWVVNDFDPDLHWLEFPLTDGRSWNGQSDIDFGGQTGRVTYQVQVTDILDYAPPFGLERLSGWAGPRQLGVFYFPDCAEVTMAYTLEASDGEGGYLTVQTGTMVNIFCPSIGMVHHTEDYVEYDEGGNPTGSYSEE
ncbi:MAG: Ig-like domain-containing protein, partial [Myxococcales bacterium]|nr:Ig-like domain-containing protein [Myxococcales bacterium]